MTKILLPLLFLSSVCPAYMLTEHVYFPGKETRKKVAIIDSGINPSWINTKYLCKGPHFDLTNTDMLDRKSHGTHIYAIISSSINIKTQCILIIKYTNVNAPFSLEQLFAPFDVALVENVKYVNYSSSGTGGYEKEELAIKKLLDRKIHVTVSAGNDSIDLKYCKAYPSCYPFKSDYFHVIGNGLDRGYRFSNSNYGGPITTYVNGNNICVTVNKFPMCKTGTSQSAAKFTAELLKYDN